MSNSIALKVESRERAGKGSSRAARRAGRIPAVIYGNKKDPEMITVAFNEIIRLLNRGGFMTNVYEVELNGKTQKVLPRDLQLDPVLDFPMHIDFLRLGKGTTVSMEVPVHFSGEEESPGIKQGGVMNVVRHAVELNCPADNIPSAIEISIAAMDVGDSLHISEVTLPEGCVATITDRDFTIVTMAAPTVSKASDDAPAEAETAEEGAEEGASEE